MSEPLSPHGAARRAAMLGALQEEVARSARRRKLRRRAAGAALAVLVATAGVLLFPLPAQKPTPAPPVADASPAQTIEIVSTPPDILARCAASIDAAVLNAAILSDDELLALMESAGRPSGIVASGGRTWVVVVR